MLTAVAVARAQNRYGQRGAHAQPRMSRVFKRGIEAALWRGGGEPRGAGRWCSASGLRANRSNGRGAGGRSAHGRVGAAAAMYAGRYETLLWCSVGTRNPGNGLRTLYVYGGRRGVLNARKKIGVVEYGRRKGIEMRKESGRAANAAAATRGSTKSSRGGARLSAKRRRNAAW